MRDPNRIPELCTLLQRVWESDPDLRLGQLIVNAIRPSLPCPQIFAVEDGHTHRGLLELEARLRGHTNPARPPAELECTWREFAEPGPSGVRLASARTGEIEFTASKPKGRDSVLCTAHLLELRYEGELRDGSQGQADRAAMCAAMLPALFARRPDAVLFDFSRLRYRGEEDLSSVFQILAPCDGDAPVEVVVLGGPDSFRGLNTAGVLLHMERQKAIDTAKALAIRAIALSSTFLDL